VLRRACHRLFDLSCALAGLLLLMPVLMVIALLVWWKDGAPIFFSQTRIGRAGHPFRIHKFRTMCAGVRGRAVTAAGDPRVTPLGAMLRRYKLDELPQLYNVLIGDMSLVGPRPEVPEYVQLDAPIWQAVLRVRPGITDLASLMYRDEEGMLGTSHDPGILYRESVLPAKLILNLAYLHSRSFWRDLQVIVLTIYYSLFPRKFNPELVKKSVGAGA
jgi:lipopolysaccharide/colanic/teichoic acid biosynthesis glycosyltransferase